MKNKITFIVLYLLMLAGCKKMKQVEIIQDKVKDEFQNENKEIDMNEFFLSNGLNTNDKTTNFLCPNMISVYEDDIKIEISETLITCEEYNSYLKEQGKDLSRILNQIVDDRDYIISDKMPVWGMNWIEAAQYCNWLSEKQQLVPCYEFNSSEDKIIEVTINRDASGYRLPYVRELLILSGIKKGLTIDEYEMENLYGIENDINHLNVKPVIDGKKNRYGIYDLLGNIPQFCNDLYKDDYDYYDYTLNMYGPDNYTPDEDQLYFKEPLTPVRCYFGGYFCSNFEDIKNKVVYDINEISTEIIGIRVVKELK